VNCWVFLRFYKIVRWRTGEATYRFLPAGVGVLPQINVTLIGILPFAAKWLRSHLHGRAAHPRPGLSGVAYFSLHFLMLGWLYSLLVPNPIDSDAGVLEAATQYAARGWAAVFGQPKETVPWIILDCSILGLFISGPPLLLCWIGHVLARRCAATLPRRRFRLMTCLVSLGFASAALAICLTPRPFEAEQDVALDFQVVDEVSGRPITAAFVRMTDPFSFDPTSLPPGALTDSAGRACLTGRFVASGQCNAFQRMGVFSPWGRWLEVSAADHRTRRIPLPEVLGQFADPAGPGVRKLTLARGETRENAFRDLAGVYIAGRGFGGRCFEIEPDGRFAWCESGCTYRSEEYGYLKRHGEEIELVPILHPGRAINPLVTSRYRTIEWGERLYLSSTDEHELREFCRMALTPNRPSKSEDLYGSFRRLSDRGKPQTGLPRVPAKVWVKFLIDEMSLNNREGSS